MISDPYDAAKEIHGTLVMHPQFEHILGAADEMAAMVVKTGVPAGMLVTAGPGMGKTQLLNLIELKVKKRFADLSNSSPHIGLSFDSLFDTHRMAAAFLEALNYPSAPGRASLDVVTRMIDAALSRNGTRVGSIDEAQHACEGNRDITAHAVGDWLKRRMDRHQMMLVLVGTPTLGRLRQINTQLGSRVSADFSINPFTYGAHWHGLLGGLHVKVSRIDLSIITDRKVAKMLFDVSSGNLRRLKQVLASASFCTLDGGRRMLSLPDLEKGFDAAFGTGASASNPFRGQT